MGFGVEVSVDCSSGGSPIESYYSSWFEIIEIKKYLGNLNLVVLGMTG